MSHEKSSRVRRIRSFVLSLALLASASSSGRALTPNGPHPDLPPQREILLNGLRVAVVETPGDRTAVVCAVRAGAMFDPAGKSGLANLTAGLMLRGAGSYSGDRIRGELQDAGATLSVRTDWDATWIEAEAPSGQLSTVLDVMSLMVSSPRFAQEDIDAIRKEALEHVSGDVKNADALADRAFARALYGKHTYGRSIWGDATSLASITRGDVQVFYDRFYAANAAVLGVAGPSSLDVVTELARPRFGRWAKRKVVPATFLPPDPSAETRVFVVDMPGVADPVVRAGFWTQGRSSADATATFRQLAYAMCGELRERVPANGPVVATYDPRALQSPFVVRFSAPVGRLGDSIAGVQQSVADPRPDASTGCGVLGTMETPSALLLSARTTAATDFFAAQNLNWTPAGIPADAARLATAKASLKPTALTVVVVGDAKQISAALAERFKVEVIPAT